MLFDAGVIAGHYVEYISKFHAKYHFRRSPTQKKTAASSF